MHRKFRLALIGVGKVTLQCHLPAALSLPDVEIGALVDTAMDRACEVADDYGLKPLMASTVEDIIGEVDGAVIATPNHLHADAAVTLLNAGVPVLIEKPLAATVEQGERIVKAAGAAGIPAGVGYCSRFQDNVAFMGGLIRDGYFGHIRRFVFQSGTRGGWAPFSAYNTRTGTAGGGVVMITATHFLDRMLHWFGMPVESQYFDDAEGGPEANAIMRFRFERDGGPTTAALRFSKTRGLTGGMVLDTAKGRVYFGEDEDSWPVLAPAGGGVHLTVKPDGAHRRPRPELDRFQRQLLDFVRACEQGRDPEVPVAEGQRSLELIHAMYAARRPLAEAEREPLADAEVLS
ncbi:MAG TPA: Gfo/Idh/MocA family oxidoreductase [Gammaproteobacteria bacterium]|nr:Gfo/Idh/MocA family oxidoreductase [Gammaproteobacteria bacterium]